MAGPEDEPPVAQATTEETTETMAGLEDAPPVAPATPLSSPWRSSPWRSRGRHRRRRRRSRHYYYSYNIRSIRALFAKYYTCITLFGIFGSLNAGVAARGVRAGGLHRP